MSDLIEQLMLRYEGGGLTRRELVVALSTLFMARPAAGGTVQPGASPIPVTTLNHVTLTVGDVQRSIDFYQRVLGLPVVTTQGTEADWSAPTVPVLGIGEGPQFIALSQGSTPSINHYCLGMDGFDAREIVSRLAEHGVEAGVRRRADSDPPSEELMFRDPDGIAVQIQDTSYCGGSGVLGDLCSPEDRQRNR